MSLIALLLVAVGCGGSTKSAPTVATSGPQVQESRGTTSTTTTVVISTTEIAQQSGDPIDDSSGWVAIETTDVVYLSWIETKGQLNGTLQIAALSKGQVTPTTRSFSGQHVGKQVSLNIEGLGVWQGTLDGLLTIRVPQKDGTIAELFLTKGGIDRYNTAVRALQADAGETRTVDAAAKAAAAADAELASAQHSVTRAIADLKATLPQLTGVMKIYDDVSHAGMDRSLAVVDRFLAKLPADCLTAGSAVGSAESERRTVSSQRGTLNISLSTINAAIKKLSSATDNLITVDPVFIRSDLADETNAAIKQATDDMNAATTKADTNDTYGDRIVTAAKERLQKQCP